MEDEVKLPGDFQLDLERGCVSSFTKRRAPITFFSRSLRKLFVGSGIFYVRTWLGLSVDDNFRYHMPKFSLTHDRNWSRVSSL